MKTPALVLSQSVSDTAVSNALLDAPPLFLRGQRIGLRALDKSDIGPHYLNWLQDRDITRHMETGAFPLTLDDLHRYYNQLAAAPGSPPACVFFAIQHLAANRHIGNIKMDPIHWLHRTATLGIVIGEKAFHGQGLGEEAMRLCLDYAFGRLGLRKVSLGVLAGNTRAIALYERLGFVLEGCKRREFWSDGAFHDAHIMGLFAEDFTSKELTS